MSKPATGTASKNPTQLPTKSAWAKGPPQSTASSSRPQSPVPSASPHQTHSRRPSALGQGIPIKDGVTVSRGNAGAAAPKQAVTFGSIDDVSAPISSSPAKVPVIKSEGVKSFGTVPATSNHVNGNATRPAASSVASTSTPASNASSVSAASTQPSSTPSTSASTSSTTGPTKAKAKLDIRKMFQGGGSTSSPAPDTTSPSVRPSPLPTQQSSSSTSQPGQSPSLAHAQPSQLGSHSYSNFRPQQPQNGNGPQPPRSPVYARHPSNGNNGQRQSNGPSTPGQAPMGSPRLAPPPHPGQPSGMPPQPQLAPQHWPGYPNYYYPGMPSDPYMAQYSPQWYMAPQHGMPPHQPVHPQPSTPQSAQHGLPMSPRNPAIPLQPGPGTPQSAHATLQPNSPRPHPAQTHSHHSHSSSLSVGSNMASPPATPSSGPRGTLNTNASTFVPGSRPQSKVIIKNSDGTELSLGDLSKSSSPAVAHSPAVPSPSPNRKSIVRLESEDDKKRRIAEEEKEKQRVAKEAEEKKAEQERKLKEAEEERKKKAEAEELEKAKKLKEEEEAKEKERLKKEEEERLKKEEEERLKKEAEERVRLEEEKKKQAEADEKERQRKAEEEKEKENERLRAEEAARVAKEAEAAKASAEPEEGEVKEDKPAQSTTDKKAEAKDKPKDKEILRVETSAMGPPMDFPRRRPGPLDLSNTGRMNIPSPLPSALATARIIEDITSIQYPEGIQSPKEELNIGAKDGKFRYDRDFLLQFMQVCKEKPDMLPPLDAIGLEPVDQSSFAMSRGGSNSHRQRTNSSANVGRQNSIGLGLNQGPFKSGAPNPFGSGGMGNFSTPGSSKLSSEDRFAMSTSRSASVGGQAGLPFGRPAPMTRTASQGGGAPMDRNRNRSKRGEKRNDGNRVNAGQQGYNQGHNQHNNAQAALNLEPVAPLQTSKNAWAPASVGRKPTAQESDSPEVVDRKVKSLLNKLTMEKFDSISDQIIAWANKSEKEKDGRTLIQVIRLVFEKATDEAAWSEMYARLCRKMMEQISPQVQDDGIKNPEGKPIAGGQLFRKYLLNRCQEDFERGWGAKETTAAAAASKAAEDKAAGAANEKGQEDGEEIQLYSDEYYAAQKAKRQGLGLIKFIGELFKLQMLTERIMHECIKKLLGNVENPEEEEIESLCKLLSTVGGILDMNNKARAHMDIYFTRMKELTKSTNVSSRMQFMLQDVVELRERKWVSRNAVAAPTTIAAVHEQAAKEKVASDKESYQRQMSMSMSRSGSRRGHDRSGDGHQGPDGWTPVAAPRPPPKAGDLSNFGKISKGAPMTFGPSSVFNKKESKRESLSRTASSSNMFSMLSQNAESTPEVANVLKSGSRPPSRKPSIDLGSSPMAEPAAPPQRKRLVLQPRTKTTEGSTPPTQSQPVSEDEDEAPRQVQMSEADAKKKIAEDSKEFFAVRNLDEAEDYFTAIPSTYHPQLVETLVSTAADSNKVDWAQLTADLFSRGLSKSICSAESLEQGLSSVAEIIDDLAIDAPKATSLFATIIKGCMNEEQRTRIASKSADQDKLLSLFSS